MFGEVIKDARNKLKNNYGTALVVTLIYLAMYVAALIAVHIMCQKINFSDMPEVLDSIRLKMFEHGISYIVALVMLIPLAGTKNYFVNLYKQGQNQSALGATVSDMFAGFRGEKKAIKVALAKLYIFISKVEAVFIAGLVFIAAAFLAIILPNFAGQIIVFDIFILLIALFAIEWNSMFMGYIAICKPEMTMREMSMLSTKYVAEKCLALLGICTCLYLIPMTILCIGIKKIVFEIFGNAFQGIDTTLTTLNIPITVLVVIVGIIVLLLPFIEEIMVVCFFKIAVAMNGDKYIYSEHDVEEYLGVPNLVPDATIQSGNANININFYNGAENSNLYYNYGNSNININKATNNTDEGSYYNAGNIFDSNNENK